MEILQEEALLERLLDEFRIEEYFTHWKEYRTGVKLVRFPKGTFLYGRPEHKKYAYFLVSGKLKVSAALADGRQMLVRFCEDFIFIGDMELLGYLEPANVTETVTDCLFIGIDLLLYREELLADPGFLRFLCDTLAEKLSYFARMQCHNRMENPMEKLAAYILESAEGKGYFKENLRRTSDQLGISYRHLHRLLGELVDKGVLKRTQRGYLLMEERRLKEFTAERLG